MPATLMVFQDLVQPVRERLDLLGPRQGVADVAVDLGEHAIQDEVLELLLAADVAVERAGNHPSRAARARMVSAATPSWAISVSASATTTCRLRVRRRSSSVSGALNHSGRALALTGPRGVDC